MTPLPLSTGHLSMKPLKACAPPVARGTEGVVLWLAKRPLTEGVTIAETYVPEHYAEVDVFRIPPSGMTAMMAHLREGKLGPGGTGALSSPPRVSFASPTMRGPSCCHEAHFRSSCRILPLASR